MLCFAEPFCLSHSLSACLVGRPSVRLSLPCWRWRRPAPDWTMSPVRYPPPSPKSLLSVSLGQAAAGAAATGHGAMPGQRIVLFDVCGPPNGRTERPRDELPGRPLGWSPAPSSTLRFQVAPGEERELEWEDAVERQRERESNDSSRSSGSGSSNLISLPPPPRPSSSPPLPLSLSLYLSWNGMERANERTNCRSSTATTTMTTATTIEAPPATVASNNASRNSGTSNNRETDRRESSESSRS